METSCSNSGVQQRFAVSERTNIHATKLRKTEHTGMERGQNKRRQSEAWGNAPDVHEWRPLLQLKWKAGLNQIKRGLNTDGKVKQTLTQCPGSVVAVWPRARGISFLKPSSLICEVRFRTTQLLRAPPILIWRYSYLSLYLTPFYFPERSLLGSNTMAHVHHHPQI